MQKDDQIDRQVFRQTVRHMKKQTEKQIDRHMDRQTGRETNWHPDELTDLKEACKKYHALTAERLPQLDPLPRI